MVHIYAAVAEKEAASPRTRAALQAAKARGVQLGNPEIGKRNHAAADALAETLRAVVAPLAG
jgi:DNA invertase Pin-like site-specific DNA recombinase